MPYLFTLLGITVWVGVVGFSSHALVSYENTKQADIVKGVVDRATQKVLSTEQVIAGVGSAPVLPLSQQASHSVPQGVKAASVTPAKKVVPIYYYEEEDKEDDDE